MNKEVNSNKEHQETDRIGKKSISNKQKASLVITTVLAILLISFIIQNWNKVELEFLMFTFRVRIVVIILVSAIIGGLITYLLLKFKNARKKKKS